MKRYRPPKKSQEPFQKVVRLKVDPIEMYQTISVPKIEYWVEADVTTEDVFCGKVTPIPTVLIYYLSRLEFLVYATIVEQINEHGECNMTSTQMGKFLKRSSACISNVFKYLRRCGILMESKSLRGGRYRKRFINYKAVQRLSDLVEGEDQGVYQRIRKATKKSDIMHLTKDDIREAYDNYVLPPGHDPEEEEEYD